MNPSPRINSSVGVSAMVLVLLLMATFFMVPAMASIPDGSMFDNEEVPDATGSPAETKNDTSDTDQPPNGATGEADEDNPYALPPGLTGVVDSESGGAKIRTEPWGEVIGRLRTGVKVTVLEQKKGWYKVQAGELTGWIRMGRLDAGGEDLDIKKEPVSGTVSIEKDKTISIRDGKWGNNIGTLKSGDKVKIMGRDGDWYIIQNKGKLAYVYRQYIDKKTRKGSKPGKGDKPKPGDGGSSDGGSSDDGGSSEGDSGSLPSWVKKPGLRLLGWLKDAGFKGNGLRVAWAIGMRESSGDPTLGPGHEQFNGEDYGLFQFNKPSWGDEEWWNDKKLLDPVYNAGIVFKMSKKGTYWLPWGLNSDGTKMDARFYEGIWTREQQQEWIWDNYKKYYDMFPKLAGGDEGEEADSPSDGGRDDGKKPPKEKKPKPGEGGQAGRGTEKNGILDVPERKQGVPENYPIGGSVCGPTSLAMCLEYFGKKVKTLDVGAKMGAVGFNPTRFLGTDPFKILAGAKAYGFKNSEYNESGSVDWLKKMTSKGYPVIFNAVTSEWPGGHYMVCTGVKGDKVYFNDPAIGTERTYSASQVKAIWKMNRAVVVKG